jgi:hypothetical protein
MRPRRLLGKSANNNPVARGNSTRPKIPRGTFRRPLLLQGMLNCSICVTTNPILFSSVCLLLSGLFPTAEMRVRYQRKKIDSNITLRSDLDKKVLIFAFLPSAPFLKHTHVQPTHLYAHTNSVNISDLSVNRQTQYETNSTNFATF